MTGLERLMRRSAPFLVLLGGALASAAEVGDRVAVVPYQGTGRDPELVISLIASLRAALVERGWPLTEPGETDRQVRAGAMCGEDVECLATIGRRIDAKWVLALGVGRVAGNTMVSALLVDAVAGTKSTVYTETIGRALADLNPVAKHMCDALLVGLSPVAKLVPPDSVTGSPPPLVEPLALPAPPLRSPAVGTAIGAGVLAVAGGIITILAQQSFARLPDVPLAERDAADAQQRSLNLAADVLVGCALVAGATAVVLFILDGRSVPPPAVFAGSGAP